MLYDEIGVLGNLVDELTDVGWRQQTGWKRNAIGDAGIGQSAAGIVVVVGYRRHRNSSNYRILVCRSSCGRLGYSDGRNGRTQTANAATHRRRGSGSVLPVDLMAGT